MPEAHSPQIVIEVEHLLKKYPKAQKNAVDDLTFSIQRGEIFGLLGPNGAGKTTTIGILTTSAKPDSGRATIMGWDVATNPVRVKQHIAVIPQRSNLDKRLSARSLLLFHAKYHNMPRADREKRADYLLKELGLSERARDNVTTFSGGMAQRLLLARALMHTPDVLVLDEPTNSLDPQSRLFLWDQIRMLNQQGLTILLTTHDLHEAEQLCDRIAIMDEGRILVSGTLPELQKRMSGSQRLELRVKQAEPAVADNGSGDTQHSQGETNLFNSLLALSDVSEVEEITTASAEHNQQDQEITTYHIFTANVEPVAAQILQIIIHNNANLYDLHLVRPSLEDVFIDLTGRKLR
jgi:ABC-2 type transport system ATP-binding protein